MITKTEQLNTLFDRWQVLHNENGFKRDGIINEELFSKPYILFVCKEPNDPDQKPGDYRDWWNNEMTYAFSKRIGDWAYGIINGFPPYQSFSDDQAHQALKSVAFMNVKKVGGGARANHDEILNWIERDHALLHEEIEIINPSVIICSLGFSHITKKLFNNISDNDWQDAGYGIPYAKLKDRLIIDFYHPSVPAPGVMSYVLLEKIVQNAKIGS
jgi:hypothetical protein